MNRVALRLLVFALMLAGVFGGAYALGEATDGDHPVPAHDMDMP